MIAAADVGFQLNLMLKPKAVFRNISNAMSMATPTRTSGLFHAARFEECCRVLECPGCSPHLEEKMKYLWTQKGAVTHDYHIIKV